MSFSNDTAAKTGKSKRTIERAIQIANELGNDILTAIAGASLPRLTPHRFLCRLSTF